MKDVSNLILCSVATLILKNLIQIVTFIFIHKKSRKYERKEKNLTIFIHLNKKISKYLWDFFFDMKTSLPNIKWRFHDKFFPPPCSGLTIWSTELLCRSNWVLLSPQNLVWLPFDISSSCFVFVILYKASSFWTKRPKLNREFHTNFDQKYFPSSAKYFIGSNYLLLNFNNVQFST